ncbi:MAG TPA: DUF456 domain-containing protein [Trueperaceae bacterium]
MNALALVVFVVFYLVAVAGIVLPFLPGVPVAAVGALLAGWMTGFQVVTWTIILWVVVLTLLSVLIDYAAGLVGARGFGASAGGIWGSIVGSLVGLFFFPPFGFLVGAIVGAVLGELVRGRAFEEAMRAGFGTLVGTFGGMVAKFFVVIALGIVVIRAFF